MQFCPRTSRIYVAFRSGGVWTFDPHTGEERKRCPEIRHVSYGRPAVSTDGRTVVLRRYAANERALIGYSVADDGSFTEAWVRPEIERTGAENQFEFTFRPHTNQLFGWRGTWNSANAFEWVNAQTGLVAGTLALAVSSHIAQWALAPDGNQVAWFAKYDLYVQRFDEPEPRVLPANGEYRRGLSWSPDSRTLAYTTKSTVRFLDAATFTEVRAFDWGMGKAHRSSSARMDFSRASAPKAAGVGSRCLIWSNCFMQLVTAGRRMVSTLAFSPIGDALVAVCNSTTPVPWDAPGDRRPNTPATASVLQQQQFHLLVGRNSHWLALLSVAYGTRPHHRRDSPSAANTRRRNNHHANTLRARRETDRPHFDQERWVVYPCFRIGWCERIISAVDG